MKNLKHLFLLLAITTYSTKVLSQKFEWAKAMGGIGFDLPRSIGTDRNGNVYSTGSFSYTVDFDPGPDTLNITTKNGIYQFYIQKLDANGNLKWVKHFGGKYDISCTSIHIDNNGNVYTTGRFRDTVDFDPNAGVHNMITAKSANPFILKLDSDGQFVWSKKIRNYQKGDGSGNSITTDENGNVLISGVINGTYDFDPGPGIYFLSAYSGFFIQKLNSNGNFIWAKIIDNNGFFRYGSIATDHNGNVFTCGAFTKGADFDPGIDTFYITSVHYFDGFILKLDSNGIFRWATSLGYYLFEYCSSLAIDASGNLIVAGVFAGTIDFDPDTSVHFMHSNGYQDGYILKLNTDGKFIWAVEMGKKGWDRAFSTSVDQKGNIYTVGTFMDTVDFDPGPAKFFLVSQPKNDATFIQKLDSNGHFIWAKALDDNIFLGGESTFLVATDTEGNVYVGCSFADTIDADPGSGIFTITSKGITDILILKLSQCHITKSIIVAVACDSFTFNNFTYYQTSAYLQSLTNSDGCDSLIKLKLTILKSSDTILYVTACESFVLNNQTYYYSGTYYQTIPNMVNCDSTITLNLTINSIDTSVTQNGTMLTANLSGATYQWLDCDAAYAAIQSQTNQSFTPVANGNYAAMISKNGCIDTTLCYTISTVGMHEISSNNIIKIYPNPTTSEFTIETEKSLQNIFVTITDAIGNIVSQKNISQLKKTTMKTNPVPGVYFISIVFDGEIQNFKLLVQ